MYRIIVAEPGRNTSLQVVSLTLFFAKRPFIVALSKSTCKRRDDEIQILNAMLLLPMEIAKSILLLINDDVDMEFSCNNQNFCL